jgi:enoyl-CoA hydratase/carnithine racemase
LAVIATKLPARTTQEAVLTGRRYAALDAASAGIVHQVASEDQVLPQAIKLAVGLAAKERPDPGRAQAAALRRGDQGLQGAVKIGSGDQADGILSLGDLKAMAAGEFPARTWPWSWCSRQPRVPVPQRASRFRSISAGAEARPW